MICPNCGYCPHCGRGGHRHYHCRPWVRPRLPLEYRPPYYYGDDLPNAVYRAQGVVRA